MKTTCEQTKRLMDLMDGSLSKKKRRALRSHIQGCVHCQSFMEDFYKIDMLLSNRKRLEPSQSFMQLYHEKNSCQFGADEKPVRRKWADDLILHPAPVIRLAHALGMLILGVSLGWVLFHHDQPATRTTDRIILQRSPSSIRQVNAFFQESEIWLLDVMNLPQNGSLEAEDWNMTIDQAEQLLKKIVVIRELTKTYEEPRLQSTLNGLEILLLDMINSQEKDRSESIRQIKQTITELDLLLKVNILYDHIRMAAQHV